MSNELHGATGRLLRRGLKFTHLRLLAALADHEQISAAAGHLAMSQPAASRLLAEMETIVATKLYGRHPRGITLTPPGLKLAQWARRILDDVDAAEREIEEIDEGRRGSVSVGSVTGPALDLVLPVLKQIRVTYPGIVANVDVDTSDRLVDHLLSGALDFYVGRVPRDADHSKFAARVIGPEPVSLIVRPDHPLTRAQDLTLGDCVDFDWILQAPGGLLRHTVETYLLEKRVPLPARVLSTSSTLMTLALISQSNAIAPIARAVGTFFGGAEGMDGRIAVLPVAEDLSVSAYSILTLKGRRLSPASQIVYDQIERKAAGMVASRQGGAT